MMAESDTIIRGNVCCTESRSSSIIYRFLADIFGVSPLNEDGTDRIFGYYSFSNTQFTSLWFIIVPNSAHVEAYYNVSLIATTDTTSYYIIHPLPDLREAIYDHKIYKRRFVRINGYEIRYYSGWTLYPSTSYWESDSDSD
jgi:hypothetical protein